MKPRVRIRDGKPVFTTIDRKRPNRELVELLESLLESAQSGDMISMAYVAGWTGNWLSNGWALDPRSMHVAMLGEWEIGLSEFRDRTRLKRGDSILENL